MFSISWKKMFPALLTAVCVALVNMSRSIRTSVPSILSSATALMPTSDVLCAEGNSRSWILLLHPVSVKSLRSVEREFHRHINFVQDNHAICKYWYTVSITTVTWFTSWPEQELYAFTAHCLNIFSEGLFDQCRINHLSPWVNYYHLNLLLANQL